MLSIWIFSGFAAWPRGEGQLKEVVLYIQEQVIKELRLRYSDIVREETSPSLPETLL